MNQATRTLTQKTASGVAWISGFQIARQLLQIVSISVVARRVPPAAYGLVAMAALVTSLLETIRDLGTGQALVRERELPEEFASTGFWLNLGFGGAVTLVIVGLSWPAAQFFHEPQVGTVLRFLSAGFFLGTVNVVPTALLQRELAFRKLAVAQTVGAVCGTTVGVIVALAGGNVWSLISGSLTNSFATTVGVLYLSPFRAKAVFRVKDARRILSFGLHLTGYNVFNYFSRNADNLLVGKYLGPGPLGYYQMGYMLMTYPLQNFSIMVAQVVYPTIARFQDDLERFRAAYLRTCALISLVTFPVMLGLAVTAYPFIRVFLGPRWNPVAGLLVVFAPLGAAESVNITVGLIYNTSGRPDLRFRWTIFASCAYVASFLIGLRWGIMGVASCYAIVWALLMVPSFLIPFRLVGLLGKAFMLSLWPTLWMSLVMALVSALWLTGLRMLGVQNAAIALISTSAVGAALYLALLFWRRPPVLAELQNVLQGSSNPLARRLAHFLTSPSCRAVELPQQGATASTDQENS